MTTEKEQFDIDFAKMIIPGYESDINLSEYWYLWDRLEDKIIRENA